MATPTITLLNSNSLTTADANTGWNDLTTADADIKVEGSASMSGVFRADGEQGYYDAGGAPVSAAGKTVRGWIFTNNIAYMGTLASDPYKLLAFDGTTTELKALFGSDTYPGGWFNYIWDMDDFTTLTLANVDRWGVECGHASSAKNVVNTWMDAIFYLDGYYWTGGTSGDKITLSDISTYDKGTTTLRGYGIITESNSVYFCTGTIQSGNGATTTYFEMDGDILVFKDAIAAGAIAAGLYDISATGSGSNCVITNSVIKTAGTTDAVRFVIDFSDSNATVELTDNVITRAGTITLHSGMTATGNIFDDCGQITHAAANMNNCTVKNYEGTTDTGAVSYNINADPDGEMDGMSFTKGTAATHAIEFGTSIPATITLRNQTYSGYNASNNQTDSTLYFADTGGTITVNIIGGDTPSYKSAGATIDLVINPVSVTVTVRDPANALLQNARVLLKAGDTVSGLPYQESVTITQTAGTATVAHTAHGLATNKYVVIKGANEEEYNGVFQITVTGVDAYTYAVDAGADSPATGTITSTAAIVYGLTNASGVATDSRSYNVDQDVEGWVRYSSDPYYKTFPISGLVDKDSGLPISVKMVNDE